MSIAIALAMMFQSAPAELPKYETVKGYYQDFENDGFVTFYDLSMMSDIPGIKSCDKVAIPAEGIATTCNAPIKWYASRNLRYFRDAVPTDERVSYTKNGLRRIVWTFDAAQREAVVSALRVSYGRRPEALVAADPSIFCAQYGAFVLDPSDTAGSFKLTYWNTLNRADATQHNLEWLWSVCGQQQPTFREQFDDAVRSAPYISH